MLYYFEDLHSSGERCARCFRNDELIRGSNTNNSVDTQFMIIKDSLLKRQRQFNITMLHYKRRLLPVADGTSNGVYSQHFRGTHYKSIMRTFY